MRRVWNGLAALLAAVCVPVFAQMPIAVTPSASPGVSAPSAASRTDSTPASAVDRVVSGFAAPEATESRDYGPRLVREHVRIPADGGAYSIATTILRPAGPGPYGVVVLNHGVPAAPWERRATSWKDFAWVAPVFARRGYVVVMPMRRGFGATGGEFAEDAGSCRHPHYLKGENAAADDVMAAYNYARTLPYVDPQRMILAGQSAGGMTALFAAGMRHPKGLVAVLAFAAGRGGNPYISPGVPCAVKPMARMFERLGRRVKVPVLFHYAENDRYFGVYTSEFWYRRFAAGGAPGEYVLEPPYGRDGHHIFGDLIGVEYWLPVVKQFLAEHDVPFRRLDYADPALRPLLHAKLPDVMSTSCAGLYRVFLESPGPRAYAVSGDGHCGFAANVQDAKAQALRQCGTKTSMRCALYAVDASVVWNNGNAPATLSAGLEARTSQGK